MASSDSDDFESADEDVLTPDNSQTELDTKAGIQHVPVIQSCLKEEGGQETVEQGLDQGKSEAGAGDVLSSLDNKAADNILDHEVGHDKEETVAGPISRKQRQQKHREQKTSSKPKKLGTKITAETKPVQPVISSPDEIPSENNPEPTTGQDLETKLLTVKQDPELDLGVCTTSDIDPYAKFRGYSMPPMMQQCWEDGVDNNLLYGISSEPKPSEIENRTSPIDNNLVTPLMDKLSQVAADKHTTDSTWGGWGNWGVTSLLSSATEGVSTLTSHVSSVLESGIGAPNPEELARINQLERNKFEAEATELPVEDSSGEEPTGIFSFGQLMTSMSSISKLVESTGSKVLSGGLDTLETIGKKTMEVLQEGDPGLKKKRALFSDTTVLSQILREAKEQAELDNKDAENKQAMRTIHFETLFDDYQGLVHLEALEMLSKQCDLKLQSLLLSSSGQALSQLQGKLQEVKETCQLPDDEEINEEENEPSDWWKELSASEEILGIPIATDKLSRVWNETQEWLKESKRAVETKEDTSEEYSAKEIHKKAVSTLAQLTATSVEQFHKGAELLLVKEKRDPAEEAKTLKQITSVLCLQVSSTATNFCEHLNNCTEASPSDSVNSLITNIFLEASNSSSYIQEAFQLLIPVLQVGVTS